MRSWKDMQSIYRRDGKWGQTNATTIAPWGHEQIISNGHENIMREMKQNIYVYIGETGNEGKPRPQPLQHEDMNQPFQTVECTPTIPHTPYIFIKSAIFGDGDVRSLNTTMVELLPASSSTPSLRMSVCYPGIRLLADMIRRPYWARICAAVVRIYNKNSILH